VDRDEHDTSSELKNYYADKKVDVKVTTTGHIGRLPKFEHYAGGILIGA